MLMSFDNKMNHIINILMKLALHSNVNQRHSVTSYKYNTLHLLTFIEQC